LPDIHLSATLSASPEGPVSDGNGRSASAHQRKERTPVPEDAANQPPANGQSQPELRPRLKENGRLLTAREVAELLAVPESWVREATRAGRLPHLTLGRYRRYSRRAIDAWLAQQQAGPVRGRQSKADLHSDPHSSL
jgi:excisionase family DNA binding protein